MKFSSALSFWREHNIPITHLHRCHLLDYEHQLPSIIVSHCKYSLRVGKGQDVKYDHHALEKHLLNRFIYGKPLILLDFPQVVYRKDIYSTVTFTGVRDRVKPQVCVMPILTYRNRMITCCPSFFYPFAHSKYHPNYRLLWH